MVICYASFAPLFAKREQCTEYVLIMGISRVFFRIVLSFLGYDDNVSLEFDDET